MKQRWPISSLKFPDELLLPPSVEVEQEIDHYLLSQQPGLSLAEKIPLLYRPMAAWIAENKVSEKPLLVGINGAQGSGKSTLAGLLQILLEKLYNKKVVSLSIDDLYLTLQERQRLASEVHPLLVTRGVPGTHDVSLANTIFDGLLDPGRSEPVTIPRFDKSIDDRAPVGRWDVVEEGVDIVLFEGWCVGAIAQDDEALSVSVNSLESMEDSDGSWRAYVNSQLKDNYRQLFERLDLLMMLKVPSMQQVYDWRGLQESQLNVSSDDNASAIMDKDKLKRFIMHFERLTRYQLDEMPHRADVLMPLDVEHQITSVSIKSS